MVGEKKEKPRFARQACGLLASPIVPVIAGCHSLLHATLLGRGEAGGQGGGAFCWARKCKGQNLHAGTVEERDQPKTASTSGETVLSQRNAFNRSESPAANRNYPNPRHAGNIL